MKRLLCLVGVLFFVYIGIWAEDEAPQSSAESLALPVLPPLVFNTVNTVGLLSTNNFLLLDGNYLNYQQMKERLLAVPGNKKYLSRAKGFEIGSFIGLGVGVAGGISYLVLALIPDFSNRELFKDAAFAAFAVGNAWAIVAISNSNWYLRYAVQNYNLSVMGIPIPTNRR